MQLLLGGVGGESDWEDTGLGEGIINFSEKLPFTDKDWTGGGLDVITNSTTPAP